MASHALNGVFQQLTRAPRYRWPRRLAQLTLVAVGIGLLANGNAGIVVSPTAGPRSAADDYLLLPRSELLSLPTSGAAWDGLKAAADGDWGTPDLCDQDVKHGTLALAGALVYARTGVAAYAAKTHAAIMAAMGTERSSCSTLAIGRQLGGYVLAADFSKLGGAELTAYVSGPA